jgi:hypothetical protein
MFYEPASAKFESYLGSEDSEISRGFYLQTNSILRDEFGLNFRATFFPFEASFGFKESLKNKKLQFPIIWDRCYDF